MHASSLSPEHARNTSSNAPSTSLLCCPSAAADVALQRPPAARTSCSREYAAYRRVIWARTSPPLPPQPASLRAPPAGPPAPPGRPCRGCFGSAPRGASGLRRRLAPPPAAPVMRRRGCYRDGVRRIEPGSEGA
eukprot:354507-Chlamydomonas_euryale.AAC.4